MKSVTSGDERRMVMQVSVRALRLDKGFSQKECAEALNISANTYGKKERGEVEFTWIELNQLCDMLHVQIGDLKRPKH